MSWTQHLNCMRLKIKFNIFGVQFFLTCNLHLSTTAIIFTTSCNWLAFDWNDFVVVDLFRFYFFDMMIIAKLWKLSLEVFILIDWVKTLHVINMVNFGYGITWNSFPFVIPLNSCWLAWFKIEVPMRRCFWFLTTSWFNMSKKIRLIY